MKEKSVIEDVRAAKIWLDAQSGSLAEHIKHLQRIEKDFAERSGDFRGISLEPTPAVRAMIEAAEDEPGRGLLGETRPAKTG